jgi:phospholipid/cholesterol/gamma-HCH transport system substrate-binding protein
MATVSRPGAPPGGSPSGANGGGPARGAGVSRVWLPRALALGALGLVVLIVAYLLFSGGKSATYHLIFDNGGKLVRGDQVQVGGVPVGGVTNIELTPQDKAEITIEVQSSLLPLHSGTTAQIRVPSLGSVAGRYIALAPGPNNMPALPAGSTLPTTATKPPVDLDQLFNTLNPATRRGLQQFIEGSATQYKGVGRDINAATPYFSPAVLATDRIFNELLREEPTFVSFLVETAKAVSTIAAHREQLGSLVRNASTTFGAIAAQQSRLQAGLKVLPETLREGNGAFAHLPATVASLRRLFEAFKPNAKALTLLFTRLRGLFQQGTQPTLQLSEAISKPGPNNDLTDLARAVPGLFRSLQTSSPDSVKALQQSAPITAFFGPYSPDLIGLFDSFGLLTGYRDANGQYARVSPTFADFALRGGEKLVPVTPQQGLEGLKTGQMLRCPGAATQPASDGSSPFTDEGLLGCNPGEVP